MFKKEKKKDPPEQGLGLNIQSDRRRYFRIEPDPAAPVFLADDSQKYQVVDVAAGGLAFEAGSFAPGREYRGRLSLPGLGVTSLLTLRAVRKVRDKVVGAEIVDIGEDDREIIHTYVLQRQKELIKKNRM